MIRRPPRSTQGRSSAASDVYKRQSHHILVEVALVADRAALVGRDPLVHVAKAVQVGICLLYTSPSPRDRTRSRMPSSA